MPEAANQTVNLIGNSTNAALKLLVTSPSTWGLQVLGALAVLAIGRCIANRMRRLTARSMEKAGADATLIPFFSALICDAVIVVVVAAVLNLFGVQTASIIAVVGAAGLAVGLAMQGTLANFASGVMLLVFRPFRVGDCVDVAGTAGSWRRAARSPARSATSTSSRQRASAPRARAHRRIDRREPDPVGRVLHPLTPTNRRSRRVLAGDAPDVYPTASAPLGPDVQSQPIRGRST